MSLPNGYAQIEYIQSSGTQHIDTKYKANNNTRIVIDIQITDASVNNQWLYGARDALRTNSFGFYWYNSAFGANFGTEQNTISVPGEVTDRIFIDQNKEVVYLEDIESTFSSTTFSGAYNLFLFAVNTGGEVKNNVRAKLYSCQIYNGDTLVRDFVPCKNASGVAGLYDTVNGAFYTDAAGGAFMAGLEVSPSYKLVDANELDSAMTVTANAIRAKTGDTSGITWDSSTGFASAIEAIQMGANVATGSMTQGTDFQLSTGGIFVQGIGFKANKIILYRTSEMFSLSSLSTGSYFISCLESGAEKDNVTNSYLCHVVAYLRDTGGNNYITTLNNIFVVAVQGGVAIFQDSDGVDNIYMAAGTYNWIAIG